MKALGLFSKTQRCGIKLLEFIVLYFKFCTVELVFVFCRQINWQLFKTNFQQVHRTCLSARWIKILLFNLIYVPDITVTWKLMISMYVQQFGRALILLHKLDIERKPSQFKTIPL